MRNTLDIIKFFNEGGALAYSQKLSTNDLSHHSSHNDKVSFLDIQDIHIQEMSKSKADEQKTKDGAKEFTLSIFGKEEKHTLPENMTIEDFKSYVLTLTDNKPFYLKHMISN